MKSAAIRFHSFGDPAKVLQLDQLPVNKPAAGELLLRFLASPINPSDLGSIFGSYGKLQTLPAVGGREGIAEIIETGPDTKPFKTGQRVLFPESPGTWQQLKSVKAASVLPVPENLPPLQAAMAAINPPTAFLLLEKFTLLQPGEWLIQNAANSAVGHYIIQLAHQRGIRTINLVRNPKWIKPLQKSGADLVLLNNDPELREKIFDITNGNLPKLGLNSVGGTAAISLIRSLADGGTLVTFGGMSAEPIRFPTRQLIFNDLRMTGFWLHRWRETASKTEKQQLMEKVFAEIAAGNLHTPIEKTFPLEEFPEAIRRASSAGRTGKILFADLR